MKGYKGFNKDMICRGNGYEKQYSENTDYEEDEAKICEKGMHYCINPFDVLDYYPFIDENGEMNEFAEVEALDDPVTDDGKKYVSKRLHIGAKIGIKGLVEGFINFVFDKAKKSSDNYVKSGSFSDEAQIGSSGNWAQIGSSGDGAKIGSSGDGAQIGSSGDEAKIGSSGDEAKIGSSGYGAKIGSSGENSVICCAGHGSMAKAKKGSWITLAEWKMIDNKYTPVCVKSVQVDGVDIKEDTFYKLIDGEFVEQPDDAG